mmetsp:Transcript_16053/g.30468  ORF Transcript_16053/g.30468 Transcript_16053/m.30468 type:complete len:81 (-) Transcript_16053:2-244(-)
MGWMYARACGMDERELVHMCVRTRRYVTTTAARRKTRGRFVARRAGMREAKQIAAVAPVIFTQERARTPRARAGRMLAAA